ncbi:MAG TPA: acyltransferase family protein [Roseiarcus sp.]|nr:acyltransferase family protein [Roseiarcus sp.]
MKRSASLDFLRGAAAFAVALPHYLTAGAPFSPAVESVAVSAVEVFFVLSGFVLAPQIVDWVVGRPWRNLGVFLVRRWMRTIPPYVAALVVVALMTGHFFTADTLRYLFYVENLFHSSNAVDFYPVAWSLAVEEWFYVLFAPLLFLIARAHGRCDRRAEAVFAILVILVVASLRAFAAPADWDLDVRRVTLFRIDSIVWGFLLYLALEGRPLLSLNAAGGGRALAALGAILVAAAALEFRVAMLALEGGRMAQAVFPYASALFGIAAVGFFREADGAFKRPGIAALSFALGRISYSVYLFHIVFVMALKPLVGGLPIAVQLALYLATVCAFSSLFWRGFERPILAARPDYRARPAGVRGPAGPRRDPGGRLAPAALGVLALAAAVVARNAFMANEPLLFYAALIAAAVLALALAERLGRFARPLGVAARALVLFAIALPAVDALYRSATGVPIAASVANPIYSYRAARENPAAFTTWWFYYLNEWIREDGVRGAIEKPDPLGKLPFVLVPKSSGRMFDTTVRINSAGFRGPEIAADKGDRFRIVALGESQTFGPTLRDGEKPWPERLEDVFAARASCGRPIEVINAGTEAYTLADNVERLSRDILPLKPDLILSTHGMNGLLALGLRQEAPPNEPGPRPRASALIGRAVLTIERAAYDWRARAAVRPPPLTDAALMASPYADAYRRLIALGRESGVKVALATSSLAVDAASPREVKDFYGAVFKPIDDIVAANAAHNRMVRLVGRQEGAPVVEAIASLDGDWDDDLYLDIVHFTERGNERAAEAMFQALIPILKNHGLRCAIR